MIPLFIGGTGRSGTTILKKILSCHSKVASIPVELRVIIDPGGALDLFSALTDRWSPFVADTALQAFRGVMLDCARANSRLKILIEKIEKNICRRVGISPRRYSGAGLSYYFGSRNLHNLLSDLTSYLSYHKSRGSWAGSPSWQINNKIYEVDYMDYQEIQRRLSNFFHDLFKCLPDSHKKTHWIDDTPYNILHANQLNRLFPDMKLLHIYRDPRDVMASYRGFAWGGDDFIVIARRLNSIYRRWFEIREKTPRECYIEVGLEKLAGNPREGLVEICHFVGLEFEDTLLKIPLDKVHAGRWKHDIPEQVLKQTEPYLRPFIEAYGYE